MPDGTEITGIVEFLDTDDYAVRAAMWIKAERP